MYKFAFVISLTIVAAASFKQEQIQALGKYIFVILFTNIFLLFRVIIIIYISKSYWTVGIGDAQGATPVFWKKRL